MPFTHHSPPPVSPQQLGSSILSFPRLSILMAVYNRLELTRRCLTTLEVSLAGVIDYEVIIVDDLSTDGTRDFLQTLSAPYRVVLNDHKGNFAINNNRAATLARGELLCLLNNDTELPSGWFQPLLAALESHPDAGFIGNVQRIPATGRYDHFGVVFPPWLTPIHYGQHLRRAPAFTRTTPVTPWSAVTAACCLTRRETFFAAGGFDESYVNGCEDMDLWSFARPQKPQQHQPRPLQIPLGRHPPPRFCPPRRPPRRPQLSARRSGTTPAHQRRQVFPLPLGSRWHLPLDLLNLFQLILKSLP
jgi:glycosyltransferase involved in cell wall biosynthesis